MSASGAEPARRRALSGALAVLWRVLADGRTLAVLWALLGLGVLVAIALPPLRPGVPASWEPGASYTTWEALHPTLGWALRAIMAGAALAGLVRLAEELLPIAPVGGKAIPLESLEETAQGEDLWQRLCQRLEKGGYRCHPWCGSAPQEAQGHCVLATRPAGRRLLAASLPLGLLLVLVAWALLWRQGLVVTSPTLALGDSAQLPAPLSWQVSLQELQLLYQPSRGPWLSQAILAVGEDQLTLTPRRPVRHDGYWVALAAELPGLRVVALDDAGTGLELYPMVSNRPVGLVQRLAFVGQEEHLLAVPGANLLLRATAVGDVAPCCIQLQALDGRVGTLRAQLFVSQPTELSVGEVTLQLTPERALVLAFWRLPGLGLGLLGLALVLLGASLQPRIRPSSFVLGLAPSPVPTRWVSFVVLPGGRTLLQRIEALLSDSFP